jgi:hypothetical protein
MVFVSVACLLLAATSHWLNAANGDEAKPEGAWQPPEQDRAAYRDIIDFNIFRSDRRRIAENVDRQRNPPTPRDTTPRETVEVVEETPKDPDASWRLSGISHDADGAVAYIEHIETGELAKINGEADFSAGRISTIGLESLVYTVDDTQRTVNVGETLLGERLRPAGSTTAGSSGSSSKPASLEDRLRKLREQRARELGQAPPAAPEPEQQTAPDQNTETPPTNTPPTEDPS